MTEVTWTFDIGEMVYRRSDGETVLRETLSAAIGGHNLEPKYAKWFTIFSLNMLADTRQEEK